MEYSQEYLTYVTTDMAKQLKQSYENFVDIEIGDWFLRHENGLTYIVLPYEYTDVKAEFTMTLHDNTGTYIRGMHEAKEQGNTNETLA